MLKLASWSTIKGNLMTEGAVQWKFVKDGFPDSYLRGTENSYNP